MGVECPLKSFQGKGPRYTEFVACCIQDKFQDKLMGTLAAADPPEISVLDHAIRRLDQKDIRFRLQAALAEAGLDKDSLESLKRSLRRWELL